MKFAAIMLAAASLAAAGSAAASASASPIKSDTDFLRASRCKGIAMGLGVDATSLDSLLKAESRARQEAVMSMAKDETERAQRQARDLNRKDKLAAELAGPCTAYMGASKDVAYR